MALRRSCSRSSGCARYGRAAFARARASRSSRSPVLLPGTEALWRRLHGVQPTPALAFFEEDATSVVALTPGEGGWRLSRQRQGQQLAAVTAASTRCSARCRRSSTRPRTTSPSSASARATRPGPSACAARDALAHRLRDLGAAAAPAAAARGGRATCPTLVTCWRTRGCGSRRRTAARRSQRDERSLRRDRGGRDLARDAGSGNLYSVEFFELCARRLKPGGLVCSQKPSRRVALTFAEALPHVVDFGNMVSAAIRRSRSTSPRGSPGSARPRSRAASTPHTLAGIADRLASASPGDRNPTARVGLQPRPLPARRVRHAGGLVAEGVRAWISPH